MRSGKWKLQFPHTYRSMIGQTLGADGMPGKYDFTPEIGLALFDLEKDIGEEHDVAEQFPEVMERLTRLADAKRVELGDKLTGVVGTGVREPGRVEE